ASRPRNCSASARVATGPTRTRRSVPLTVRTGWTMAQKPAARRRSRQTIASASLGNASICAAEPTFDAAGVGDGTGTAAAGGCAGVAGLDAAGIVAVAFGACGWGVAVRVDAVEVDAAAGEEVAGAVVVVVETVRGASRAGSGSEAAVACAGAGAVAWVAAVAAAPCV